MLMVLSIFCTLMQDEPVFSGPQPGEKLVPFVVTGALGKDADQKIDGSFLANSRDAAALKPGTPDGIGAGESVRRCLLR